MHISYSCLSPVCLLYIVFFCLVFSSSAIPFHDQLATQQPVPRIHPLGEKHTRPWATVQDWIVKTLWPFSYSVIHGDILASNHALASGPFNQLLLSKYSGDIVLRFNISTRDEASSLAEASQILFLDVWEYAHDWVDIRLSKDVVFTRLSLCAVDIANSDD